MIRRKRIKGYRHFVYVGADGRERVIPRAGVLARIADGTLKRGKLDGRIVYRPMPSRQRRAVRLLREAVAA